MSASKWNNYNNANDRESNYNANMAAFLKDSKSVAAAKDREACYKRCGKHPKISNGELSKKTTEQIKAWMKCYDNCEKKHPYTTLERRLKRNSTTRRNNGNRKNNTRSRKND